MACDAPLEVIVEIMCKLERVQTVIICSQVCSLWAQAANRPSVWRSLCNAYLDECTIEESSKKCFKDAYARLCSCKRINPNEHDCATADFYSFDSLGLTDEVLRGIYAYGFEKPSKTQRAIYPIMKGHDVLVQSRSGTGKTASYVIGALHCLGTYENCQTSTGVRMPQVLILTPTREIAAGVSKVAETIGDYADKKSYAILGGCKIIECYNFLETKGSNILVSTPGRALDVIQKRKLDVSKIRLLIIDEIDEVLSRGFADQIYDICGELLNNVPRVQVAIFGGPVIPYDISQLTVKILKDPLRFEEPKYEDITLNGVSQFYVNVEKEEWKLETLIDMYDSLPIAQAIVYCNTISTVEQIAEQMRNRNYSVSVLHGDMNEKEREKTKNDFRSGATRLLITTEPSNSIVAQISMSINFDLPEKKDNYVLRGGRTGRFGRRGLYVSFVTTEQMDQLRDIEKYNYTSIREMPVNIADYI